MGGFSEKQLENEAGRSESCSEKQSDDELVGVPRASEAIGSLTWITRKGVEVKARR